jgi:hypothetical protein
LGSRSFEQVGGHNRTVRESLRKRLRSFCVRNSRLYWEVYKGKLYLVKGNSKNEIYMPVELEFYLQPADLMASKSPKPFFKGLRARAF